MSETLLRRAGVFVWGECKSLGIKLLGLALAASLLPCAASAQEFRATVTGTVADQSGAKIPDAKIDIKMRALGLL